MMLIHSQGKTIHFKKMFSATLSIGLPFGFLGGLSFRLCVCHWVAYDERCVSNNWNPKRRGKTLIYIVKQRKTNFARLFFFFF